MNIIRPTRRILPLTTVQIERLLPFSGKVVVNQGQIVKAAQAVAETYREPRYYLVDVAQALGVSRQEADHLLRCQAEDTVRKGDLLAEKKGMIRKVVSAPIDGKVILAGDGYILLQEYRPPWELPAGLPAKVLKVIPDRGVLLETTGSLIDGVWGNGRLGYGLLHTISKTPRDALPPEALGVEVRGLVLVAGHLENPRTLEIAESLPVRALILGTMQAALIPRAEKAAFPILVLDGFGESGMNEAAFRLLSTSDEREAAVLAESSLAYRAKRPLVVIPSPAAQAPSPPPATDELSKGATVRVVRAPYHGMTGRVIALLPGLIRFPHGVRARGAEIRLENGDRVRVPVANMEILIQ